jgi:hypothetical protein
MAPSATDQSQHSRGVRRIGSRPAAVTACAAVRERMLIGGRAVAALAVYEGGLRVCAFKRRCSWSSGALAGDVHEVPPRTTEEKGRRGDFARDQLAVVRVDIARLALRRHEGDRGSCASLAATISRKASKWRCSTVECRSPSRWIEAGETPRWRKPYRVAAQSSASSEISSSRCAALSACGFTPDPTILSKLGCTLARARAVPPAA